MCKYCGKKVGDVGYSSKISIKEYLLICWKAFLDCIRWYDLIFWTSAVIIGYLIWGWIGVIIVLLMDYFSSEVSAPFIFHGDKQEKPIYHRKCSAGIENCKVCNNEYDHEFNVKYNEKFRKKWYQKII